MFAVLPYYLILIFALLFNSGQTHDANLSHALNQASFDPARDLLLVHFDCKTDVDDVHTMAAMYQLMSQPEFQKVNYYLVTGTYGTQEGLYVPPNNLLELAFPNQWSDAHADFDKALQEVLAVSLPILEKGGKIWIADAGQSDFSAELLKGIQKAVPGFDGRNRFQVVQHSEWNESVTRQDRLAYVKAFGQYHKIPDGNAEGNRSPGFRSPDFSDWKSKLSDPKKTEVWQMAVDIGNKYNGKEGRYLNEAVSAGGLDFSDLSEVCWILGLNDIENTEAFFDRFSQ